MVKASPCWLRTLFEHSVEASLSQFYREWRDLVPLLQEARKLKANKKQLRVQCAAVVVIILWKKFKNGVGGGLQRRGGKKKKLLPFSFTQQVIIARNLEKVFRSTEKFAKQRWMCDGRAEVWKGSDDENWAPQTFTHSQLSWSGCEEEVTEEKPGFTIRIWTEKGGRMWGWGGYLWGQQKKKATRLCDPDTHNLRTCYIQNRRAGQQSSEKANELLWGKGWRGYGGGRGCRHLSLVRTCNSVGFCSMMRTSSVSM